MAISCKLLGHKWNGCKCERCGEIRDEQHDWNGCKCERCGKKRDEGHQWQSVPDNCFERCAVCGKTQTIPHTWGGCICTVCGKVEHDWDVCVCRHCGEQRETYADQRANGTLKLDHQWRKPKESDDYWKYHYNEHPCAVVCNKCGFVLYRSAVHHFIGDTCEFCGISKADAQKMDSLSKL